MSQSSFSIDGLRPAVLLVGFLEGLFERPEIADWASKEAAKHPVVSDALRTLSPIADRDDAEIERALTKLSGMIPAAELSRLTIDVLIAMNRAGKLDKKELAQRIDFFVTMSAEGLPSGLRAEALTLGDAFDLAEAGKSGTVAEAEARIDAFAATYGRALR